MGLRLKFSILPFAFAEVRDAHQPIALLCQGPSEQQL